MGNLQWDGQVSLLVVLSQRRHGAEPLDSSLAVASGVSLVSVLELSLLTFLCVLAGSHLLTSTVNPDADVAFENQIGTLAHTSS